MQRLTDKCVYRCRQSNVRRVLPASDYCEAPFRCLNCAQRVDYRAFGSSRKLGGAAEIWLTVTKNAFVGWALNFRVRMLLKGALSWPNTWLTVTKNAFVGWALNVRVHMLLKGAVNRSSKNVLEYLLKVYKQSNMQYWWFFWFSQQWPSSEEAIVCYCCSRRSQVGKLLRNFVQGQVDRKETSLETPRFIVSSCQWWLKCKQ